MVLRGDLSPDPSNRPEDEDLRVPADVGVAVLSSSDSEDEQISHEGYEILPQEFMEIHNIPPYDSDSQESSEDEGNAVNLDLNNGRETSAFDESTKTEQRELWNSGSNRLTDIIMDSTKEEEIKNAMAGFKLPLTAIPPWAAHIPEEELKEQLKNMVGLLNKVSSV